jgi:hypothetical protein
VLGRRGDGIGDGRGSVGGGGWSGGGVARAHQFKPSSPLARMKGL